MARVRKRSLSNSFLVVGLGNPGPNYSLNRHNVGQILCDVLAIRNQTTFKPHKSNALVAEAKINQADRLILAKPLSFMNLSGGPTSSLMKFFKVATEHLIVLHDELDIPAGSFRLKQGGGHGGHNGLRDIISAIGTNDFARVRIGIGRPHPDEDPADYVLKNFSASERAGLEKTLDLAAEATEEVLRSGIVNAQSIYHAPGD